MFALMISWSSLIMGWEESKSRSLGQILEYLVYTLGTTLLACLHSRDHIFGLIYFKLDQNACPDSVNFDQGRGGVKK